MLQERISIRRVPSKTGITDLIPSLRIWHSLNQAPFHSTLFLHTVSPHLMRRRSESARPTWKRIATHIGFAILPLVICLVILLLVLTLHFGLQLLAPTLIPLSYLIYGLVLTMSVSSAIGREQESNTYPILSVTPYGRFGLHWHYCLCWIHRSFNVRVMITAILCLGTVSAALGYSIPLIFHSPANTLFARFSHPIATGIFYSLDYIQTLVIASLLAMLVPALQSSRPAARQVAVGGLLLAQLVSYALMAFISAIFYGSADSLLYPLITLGAFGLLRETIILMLWRRLHMELNSSPAELRL